MGKQFSSVVAGSLAATGRQVSVAGDEAVAVLGSDLEGSWSLREIYDQYKLWASSWGLLRSGHSSLDYRFRKVPSIFDHTHDILLEMLQEFVNIRDSDENGPDDDLVEIAFSDSSDSENDLEAAREREGSAAQSRQQRLDASIRHLSFLLRSLHRVSAAIQNSSVRIRAPAPAPNPDNDAEGEGAYVCHLIKRDALPDAWAELPDWLQQRLINANLGRRRLFTKWQAAHEKRSRTQTVDVSHKELPAVSLTVPRDTLAVQRAPASEGGHSAAPTFMPFPTIARYLATPEPSAKSDTVSVISTQGMSPSVGALPNLPLPFRREQKGRTFDCPYCWMPCPRNYLRTNAWKEHTLRDLYPYVCLQEHCQKSSDLFAERNEWHTHHLSHLQAQTVSLAADDYPWECPFCGIEGETVTHVAEHLERISATALPFIEIEDDSLTSDEAQGTLASQPLLTFSALSYVTLAIVRLHKPLRGGFRLRQLFRKYIMWVRSTTMTYELALYRREVGLGTEHRSTSEIVYKFGQFLEQVAKARQAEVMYRRAIQASEKTLGPDHPLTLEKLCRLGSVCNDQNKFIEAKAILERVLKCFEAMGASGREGILRTADILGHVCENNNQLPDAETVYERVLEAYGAMEELDPDLTQNIIHRLEFLYVRRRKRAEAEMIPKRLRLYPLMTQENWDALDKRDDELPAGPSRKRAAFLNHAIERSTEHKEMNAPLELRR